MVFQNIASASICQYSLSICGRTSLHKIQVNTDPDTETKSFSTPSHKRDQFRSLNGNQVNFDPAQKSSRYRPPRPKQKSISMLTPKPSDLRPASKNQVNLDYHHPHKKQTNRPSHSKQVNFGPHTVNFGPPHNKQVTFDSNTKTKSSSIPDTKTKYSRRHY